MDKLMWWGYMHSNGTLQLKRWLGDHADYTTDCYGNPFVLKVAEPFEANTYEKALHILQQKLGGG